MESQQVHVSIDVMQHAVMHRKILNGCRFAPQNKFINTHTSVTIQLQLSKYSQ